MQDDNIKGSPLADAIRDAPMIRPVKGFPEEVLGVVPTGMLFDRGVRDEPERDEPKTALRVYGGKLDQMVEVRSYAEALALGDQIPPSTRETIKQAFGAGCKSMVLIPVVL